MCDSNPQQCPAFTSHSIYKRALLSTKLSIFLASLIKAMTCTDNPNLQLLSIIDHQSLGRSINAANNNLASHNHKCILQNMQNSLHVIFTNWSSQVFSPACNSLVVSLHFLGIMQFFLLEDFCWFKVWSVESLFIYLRLKPIN